MSGAPRGAAAVKAGMPHADLPGVLTSLTRRPLPFIVAAVLIAVTGVTAWAGFSRDHDRAWSRS